MMVKNIYIMPLISRLSASEDPPCREYRDFAVFAHSADNVHVMSLRSVSPYTLSLP